MALKNLFNSLKQQGLVKQIDQYLLLKGANEDDGDRKNETNSPSSAGGCSRANYYQRLGVQKDSIDARVRRIFDNGHGVHDRIQTYLEKMDILLMREVPLFNKKEEIQGHTDGLLNMTGVKGVCEILEIKSINERQFNALKEAKVEHVSQAMVYIYVAEEHRKRLKWKYPTYADFHKSRLKRRAMYAKRYQHLTDGARYTRAEKIKHKVNQHMKMDDILYDLVKPITKAVVLYECKNTQNMKDFEVEFDMGVFQYVLDKFRSNNTYWKLKKLPPRECKTKNEGRWCAYVNECFE